MGIDARLERATMVYKVTIMWDGDARVYVATSEDIPGLVMEHENADVLVHKVVNVVPDLLLLNKRHFDSPIRLRFELQRDETVVFPHAA
jgi:hypothetical protein